MRRSSDRRSASLALNELAFSVVDWSLKISIVVFIVGVVYLLLNVPSFIKVPSSGGTVPTYLNKVHLINTILIVAAAVAAVTAVLRFYEHRQFGVYLMGSGVAFYFGVTMLINTLAKGVSNASIDACGNMVTTTAVISVGVGLVRTVLGIIQALIEGPVLNIQTRRGQLTVKAKDVIRRARLSMLSPCWKLPYCSEAMAKICPVFHQKKSCWKVGRGCQCDPVLIETLVGGMAVTAAAPAEAGGSGNILSLGEMDPVSKAAMVARRWKSRPRATKPPCDRCAIYMSHQDLKHKMAGPFAIIAPIVVFFYLWKSGIYSDYYGKVVAWLNNLAAQIAFSGPDQGVGQDLLGLSGPAGQIMVAIFLGIFMVVLLARVIEFYIFRLYL